MIQITAKPAQGFWRCGVHHPPTPTLHEDGRFTDEELVRLKAETMLVVEEVEAEGKTKNKGKEKSGETDDEKAEGKGKKK